MDNRIHVTSRPLHLWRLLRLSNQRDLREYKRIDKSNMVINHSVIIVSASY